MRTHLDALEEFRSINEEKLKDLEAQLAMEERQVEARLKRWRDAINETRVLLEKTNELWDLAKRNEVRTSSSPDFEMESPNQVEDVDLGEDLSTVEDSVGEPVVSLSDSDGVLTMKVDVEATLGDKKAKPSMKARTVAQFILERADRPMQINELVFFYPDVGLVTPVNQQGKVTREFRDIVRKAIESFDTYKYGKNNYYWWPPGRKPLEGSVWNDLLVERAPK